MKSKILHLLELLDHFVIHLEQRALPARTGVWSFLFHTVFKDQAEIEQGVMDPQQWFTIDHYRIFFDEFLERGFEFISPVNLLSATDPAKKQILFTLDDGYYNNYRLLPMLEEYQVPACWFVSTGPIAERKAFWWDTLYRHALKSGKSRAECNRWGKQLKRLKNHDIEALLKKEFGADCLTPVGDLDRPVTPDELKDFAAHPLIHVGNHTRDHAILTNYTLEEARGQISAAQDMLAEWTGVRPEIFSYPNGNQAPAHLPMLDEMGFKLGVSTEFLHNSIPLTQRKYHHLRLGRYCYPSGDRIEEHSLRYRSRFSPYAWAMYWKYALLSVLRPAPK